MLHTVRTIESFSIQATDGDIGTVHDLFFDDQRWTVRYLVVDTGGWLSGRRVLVSPIALQTAYWQDRRLAVKLTQQQVENSPDVDTEQPVSRQKEVEYAEYYGYTPYWGGAGLWGAGMYPGTLAYPGTMAPLAPPVTPARSSAERAQPASSKEEHGDPHLRSAREVTGYTIAASDGDLGHVEDFLLDDETWALRYIVVDTRNWWPGKKVLVAPPWIDEIDWAASAVRVDLPRATIKDAPEYDASQPLTRAYEQQLHDYYRRPAYWDAAPGAMGGR